MFLKFNSNIEQYIKSEKKRLLISVNAFFLSTQTYIRKRKTNYFLPGGVYRGVPEPPPPWILKTTCPIIKKNRRQLKADISSTKMQFQVNWNIFAKMRAYRIFANLWWNLAASKSRHFTNNFRTKIEYKFSLETFPVRFFKVQMFIIEN